MKRFRILRSSVVAATLALACLAGVAAAEDEAWKKDAAWVSVRLGAVKSLADTAPLGNIGWGVGYRHMLTPRVSMGLAVDHDLIGRFGAASLVEVPASAELLLHFHWKTTIRPAIGGGIAAVYRKAYRSGDDYSEIQPGGFLTIALHAPITPRTVFGVEFRAMSVSSDREDVHPTFGRNGPSSGRTSVKASLSRAYW